MKADVYTKDGKKKGEISLSDDIFGLPWNQDLISQAIRIYDMNARQGSAHAKDRSEVRGGGKKPWRQKGTGKARHGSTRSPIWIGGGVTFGPRNDKDYSRKLNRKMKTKALFIALSSKLRDSEILFVEELGFSTPKTKEAKAILENLSKNKEFETLSTKKKNALLVVVSEYDENTLKSFKNMGNVEVREAKDITARDVLLKKFVLFASPNKVVEMLEGRLSAKGSVEKEPVDKKPLKKTSKKKVEATVK